jgi:hypothetical protein
MPIRKTQDTWRTVAILASPVIVFVPRFFTLLEAEGLLPQVEGLLQTLIQLKNEYEAADAELSRINQRIALAGGMSLPRDQVRQIRSRKDASAKGVKTAVEKLQEIGCLLKDVETGLVDFPTLYRGKEVYLCWKLGESSIGFWHHVEDGFPGRHPIDSEFLANHGSA